MAVEREVNIGEAWEALEEGKKLRIWAVSDFICNETFMKGPIDPDLKSWFFEGVNCHESSNFYVQEG